MSISLYFGLPGAGKSTMYAKIAYQTSKRISKGISPYKHIYGNMPLNGIDYYTVIEFDDLGKYDTSNALILIDEASLEVDNRDYKSFKYHSKQYFLMHRHFRDDVIFFNQSWNSLDVKIRNITDNVYYMYKKGLFRRWFTRMYKVPYGIIIPDPKKSDSEKLGEIVQGYCKPRLLVRLFSPRLFRPRYYKYFDSFIAPELPPLSEKNRKFPKEKSK